MQIAECISFALRKRLLVALQCIIDPCPDRFQFDFLTCCARIVSLEEIVADDGTRMVDIGAKNVQ